MIEDEDPLEYKKIRFNLPSRYARQSNEEIEQHSDDQQEVAKPQKLLSKARAKNLVPTVSWDTVPIEGVAEEQGDSDEMNLDNALESIYDSDNSLEFVRGSSRSYLSVLPTLTDRVRGSSPIRPEFGEIGSQLDIGLKNASITIGRNGEIRRRDYPSRPVLISDALIRSEYHKTWKHEWNQRIKEIERRKETEPEKYFEYPDILFPKVEVDLTDTPMVNENGDLIQKEKRANIKRQLRVVRTPVGFSNAPRTILVHVSGRQHTWVALDWAIAELANDLDYIVVVANLPGNSWYGSNRRSMSSSRSRSVSRSRSRSRSRVRSLSRTRVFGSGKDEPTASWTDGYTVGEINEALQRLIDYCEVLIGSKKLKLTVEIVIGSISNIFIDSLNAYVPDFFVVGTPADKDGSGFIVSHKSTDLSSVMMQDFPTPIFLVPAKRMGWFEKRLSEKISSAQSSSFLESDFNNSSFLDEAVPSIETDSENADAFSRLSLENRSKTVNTIKSLRKTYRALVERKYNILDNDPDLSKNQKCTGKLDAIINATLNFNKELESLGKSADLDELKRSITGGLRPRVMKKKSMLEVSEAPSRKKKTLHEENNESLSAESQNVPKIVLGSSSPSRSSSPSVNKGSGIKFAHTVKSSDGKGALQRIKSYDVYSHEMDPLDRQDSFVSLSAVKPSQHKIDSFSDSGSLRKVLSATSLDKREKRKSRLFSFLFGGNTVGSNSGSSNTSPEVSQSSSRRGSVSSQLSSDSTKKRKSIFGIKR